MSARCQQRVGTTYALDCAISCSGRRLETRLSVGLRPSRFAPALTPSGILHVRVSDDYTAGLWTCVHGGSVSIASKSSPHRKGFLVTSYVHRSMIRASTLYWAAARRIPRSFSIKPWTNDLLLLKWIFTLSFHLSPIDVWSEYECSEMCSSLIHTTSADEHTH